MPFRPALEAPVIAAGPGLSNCPPPLPRSEGPAERPAPCRQAHRQARSRLPYRLALQMHRDIEAGRAWSFGFL